MASWLAAVSDILFRRTTMDAYAPGHFICPGEKHSTATHLNCCHTLISNHLVRLLLNINIEQILLIRHLILSSVLFWSYNGVYTYQPSMSIGNLIIFYLSLCIPPLKNQKPQGSQDRQSIRSRYPYGLLDIFVLSYLVTRFINGSPCSGRPAFPAVSLPDYCAGYRSNRSPDAPVPLRKMRR